LPLGAAADTLVGDCKLEFDDSSLEELLDSLLEDELDPLDIEQSVHFASPVL